MYEKEDKMDLFKKEEKGKEILNGGKTVKLRLKSNGKYTVEVCRHMMERR